jgi:hypothetical protein
VKGGVHPINPAHSWSLIGSALKLAQKKSILALSKNDDDFMYDTHNNKRYADMNNHKEEATCLKLPYTALFRLPTVYFSYFYLAWWW